MQKKQFSLFFSLFVGGCLAAFLSSCSNSETPFTCTDPLGCVELSPEKPIKIGVLQALSGKVSPLGQAQVRGLQLALDKRKGEILSHPVVLQIEDTGCTAEGGANAALKIITTLGFMLMANWTLAIFH